MWAGALAWGGITLASGTLSACALRQLEDDLGLVGSGGGSELPSGTDGGPVDGASSPSDGASANQDASGEAGTDGGTGAVFVEASIELETVGTPYQCPGITVFSISPAAVAPGQAALLDVALTGPPADLRWTATPAGAGTFSDETALDPAFLCAHVGAVTVTVVASLEDGGSCSGVRFTSFDGTIDCLAQ
jgi:hypothetical protein